MILLIIFIVFTMFLLYAWACIIVRVNQYCSTLTSVFNMYFSYLIHYLFLMQLPCAAQRNPEQFQVHHFRSLGPDLKTLDINNVPKRYSLCSKRSHTS